jgi:hypothetical protein
MDIKYIKWPYNTPNAHKIYRHLLLQYLPKFTQIAIFGLKTCHLATLDGTAQAQLFSLVFSGALASATGRPDEFEKKVAQDAAQLIFF